MTWGERFRALAEHFGSQYKLAAALGMSQGNLHKYVNDERVPGGDILQRIITLGISPHWLMTGEGEMLWEDFVKRVKEPPKVYSVGQKSGVDIVQRFNEIRRRPPNESFIPKSPEDMYNQLVLYGGKSDWIDLPEEQQAPYREAFDQMYHEIDSANAEYEDEMRVIDAEIARIDADIVRIEAVRLKRINASVRLYSKQAEDTFLKRGKLPF